MSTLLRYLKAPIIDDLSERKMVFLGGPRQVGKTTFAQSLMPTFIRDLERVHEISRIELLAEALPERVGSPLSRKNLAQDLEVDFKTVEKWISILENVFYCFRIAPFGAPKIRAVKKENKLYLWDWSELGDAGKQRWSGWFR